MARSRGGFYKNPTLLGRVASLHWLMIIVVSAIAMVGVAMLYSVSQGDFDSLAAVQLQRFGLGMGVLILIGLVPIRFWWQLAYPFYAVVLALLVGIEVMGVTRGGAQRWIDLPPHQLRSGPRL